MTPEQLKTTCKLGQGSETCRYLIAGPKGFECAKHTGLQNLIDARVEAGTFRAQGDNCGGEQP